jgi:hypothetical protein
LLNAEAIKLAEPPSVLQQSHRAESINEVDVKDLQAHGGKYMLTGLERADNEEGLGLESESSSGQEPGSALSIDEVAERHRQAMLERGDSQVVLLDEDNIPPLAGESPLKKTRTLDANDDFLLVAANPSRDKSQELGEIFDKTAAAEELNLTEPDVEVTSAQPVGITTEHFENGNNSTKCPTEDDAAASISAKSRSPLTLGRDLVTDPVARSDEVDLKTEIPNPATSNAAQGNVPSTNEAPNPRESPDGLVRSRVQKFEQLATTTPKSRSPNFTVLHQRPQQGTGGRPHSASNADGPSEELMAHLRRRANFVECEVSVQGA